MEPRRHNQSRTATALGALLGSDRPIGRVLRARQTQDGRPRNGAIQTLTDAGGARGGAWNQHDVIVFVPRPADGLYRISASGGEATPVKIDAPSRMRGWFPSFLPDGRHLLFFSPTPGQPENSEVYVVSLDSGQRKRLFTSRSNAVYAPPGYLLFWRETTLLAQTFDAASLELHGSPVAVATSVGFNPISSQTLFSVSHSGTLVFFGGAVGQTQLTWLDRTGKQIGDPGPKGIHNSLSLSPDATSVVYDEADARAEASISGVSILRAVSLRG